MENTFPPKNVEFIPPGPYCYHIVDGPDPETHALKTLICPYWTKNPDKEDQQSGYCGYLESGDWMENGTFLLWDLCKECGLKDDYVCVENWGEDEAEMKKYYDDVVKWIDSIYGWVKAKYNEEYMRKVDAFRERIIKEKEEL